jgi:hypothetical protein
MHKDSVTAAQKGQPRNDEAGAASIVRGKYVLWFRPCRRAQQSAPGHTCRSVTRTRHFATTPAQTAPNANFSLTRKPVSIFAVYASRNGRELLDGDET